jgi:hypothetical protein
MHELKSPQRVIDEADEHGSPKSRSSTSLRKSASSGHGKE